MKERNIWILALVCSAATLIISTVHPTYPPPLRMYAAMPGLYVAMVAAWAGLARSITYVYVLTFLINSLVYYGLIRLALAVAKAKSQ